MKPAMAMVIDMGENGREGLQLFRLQRELPSAVHLRRCFDSSCTWSALERSKHNGSLGAHAGSRTFESHSLQFLFCQYISRVNEGHVTGKAPV